MNDRERQILVAVQPALLGDVSARLRAVSVSWSDTSIHFDCYFNGEVDEEDRDSMACVDTELVAMFPETHTIAHPVVRLDHPEQLPQENLRVLQRRE